MQRHAKRPLLIIAGHWQSFLSVAVLLPRCVKEPRHYRFLLKVHGSADDPITCIDSHHQRTQGLPAPVLYVLQQLLTQRYSVIAFGGGDLEEYPDFLQMQSYAKEGQIRWMIHNESPEIFEKWPVLNRKVTGIRDRLILGHFNHPKSLARVEKAVRLWAQTRAKTAWAAAALADVLIVIVIRDNSRGAASAAKSTQQSVFTQAQEALLQACLCELWCLRYYSDLFY